jgi:glycine cleavage system aminomethyltransferase T
MSVMTAMLRRHGATIVERHGRRVAVDFGSAASEAAVCRSHVGLAERSDRATLELRGPGEDVDRALERLTTLGDRAWWARLSTGRAIVRCEGEHEGTCTSAMMEAERASILDVSADYVAIELVGPRAEEVLQAAGVDPDGEDPVIIMREHDDGIELLIPLSHGPALWNRLLQAGEPYEVACVGLDALEQLTVSGHVSARRRPGAAPAERPAP